MSTIFKLHNIAFEWDTRKAISNSRKHGIYFELACEVFFDPFVFYLDEETIREEMRETIIGMTVN